MVLALATTVLSGCAGKLDRAADSYYAGKPEQALEILSDGDRESNRARLLFLFERGTILHYQGNYRESIEVFLEAERLIASFETLSVSEQGATLIGNEWLARYQGEYSERLWVHTYLMMNYLLAGLYDDALVESKRALKRFEESGSALRRSYFTRALMALSFANVGEDNDALLLYRRLVEDLRDKSVVADDIVYHASRLGMSDLVEEFRSYLNRSIESGGGELVLFVSSGRIPVKQSGNVFLPPAIRFSFPYYDSHRSPSPPDVRVSDGRILSRVSSDLGRVARDALDVRKAALMTRTAARVAGKEALAQAVGRNHDEAAEMIVRLLLLLTEEADVRCWKTLPGSLTLIRVALPPGRHNIDLYPGGGRAAIRIPEFQLRKGQRHYVPVRID